MNYSVAEALALISATEEQIQSITTAMTDNGMDINAPVEGGVSPFCALMCQSVVCRDAELKEVEDAIDNVIFPWAKTMSEAVGHDLLKTEALNHQLRDHFPDVKPLNQWVVELDAKATEMGVKTMSDFVCAANREQFLTDFGSVIYLGYEVLAVQMLVNNDQEIMREIFDSGLVDQDFVAAFLVHMALSRLD